MNNEQLILKFNPANASELKPEDLLEMRALTDEQISVLGDAYPNLPARKSYLRLYDTKLPEHKQLFQLSTWQNLRNVRKFSGKKNLVAYDFYQPGARAAARQPKPAAPKAQKVVVDMTAQEAADELRKSLKNTPPMIMAKDLSKELAKQEQNIEKIKRPVGRPPKVQEVKADQDFPNV